MMRHVAVVTGGSRGLGRACAVALAESGWTVAIGYRLIESVMRTRAAEYGFPHEALWAEMDLLRRTVSETRRRSSDGAGAA